MSKSGWFYKKFYHDEYIEHRLDSVSADLPKPLKVIRELEKPITGRSLPRAQLFLQQAQLLANYEEDDYDYDYKKEVIRYYPTYQALSNRELRAYFSWRTKWRKGDIRKTSLSFAFLYVYELLHLVGCNDAQDGYDKLTAFARDYGSIDADILPYLKTWLEDFVVYYGLDPALLADTDKVRRDNALSVLMDIREKTDKEIFQSVLELSGSVLKKSRFCKKYEKVTESVVAGVLRRVEMHHAVSCKTSWIETYFGYRIKHLVSFFDKAVFSYKSSEPRYQNTDISPLCQYRSENNHLMLYSFEYTLICHKRFINLIRTIDSLLRQAFNFPYPTAPKLKTKWIIVTINEEIEKYRENERQAAKKKLHLDLSQLNSIRSDAGETREKLLTEEETEEEMASDSTFSAKSEDFGALKSSVNNIPENDDIVFSTLSAQERRYLWCLLEGSPTNWLISEGLLPSLLCDSINEKLYEAFGDVVVEDGTLVEDYTEELKKGLQL